MPFKPPQSINAQVRLAAAADAGLALEQVVRDYVQRVNVRYHQWYINPEDMHPGFPSFEELAALGIGKEEENIGFGAEWVGQGGISILHMLPGAQDMGDSWNLHLDSRNLYKEQDIAKVRLELDSQVAIVRKLIERFPVKRARITRRGSLLLPSPPHASPENVLFIADRSEIERDYANPEVYWRAWDSAVELGKGRVLVTRALDVVDEHTFKRRIWDNTLALARAARPGLTGYNHRPPPYAEQIQALLDAGPDTLTEARYQPLDQSLEYTANVPAGGHMPLREIHMLIMLLLKKQVDDKPLELVRVIFPNRAMAEREARMLFDNHVHVLYLNDKGAREELSE